MSFLHEIYAVWSTYVEIGNRLSGVDRTRNHLHELVRGDTVSGPCVEESRERSDEGTEDEGNDVRPGGQRRLTLEYDDQAWKDKHQGQCPSVVKILAEILPAKKASNSKNAYQYHGASLYFCIA